jgi:hypothetical protein
MIVHTYKSHEYLILTVLYFWTDDEDPSSFSGKIIECSWNVDERTWQYMRVRTDKPTPNGWNTYLKVHH